MGGKKIVLLIIGLSIICIIIVWFLLQDVITKYDLERALGSSTLTLNNFIPLIYK